MTVGAQKDVQAALEAETWHVAESDNKKAVLSALMQTYYSKDYLAMPMSTLYLFGRKQDFGYEMAEPIAMVAQPPSFPRLEGAHHFGKVRKSGSARVPPVLASPKTSETITSPTKSIPRSTANATIGNSLQKANMGRTFSYYSPTGPVQGAKNATGDGYHFDGRLLVILLQ
jgi:hypothetical protein